MLDGVEYSITTATSSQHRLHLPAAELGAEPHLIIQLETIETESHCARKYALRAPTVEIRAHWIAHLHEYIACAHREHQARHRFVAHQMRARQYFQATVTRSMFALCILASFMCDALEMQVLPMGREGKVEGKTFFALELVFTVVFTIELAWNMFSYWFWAFWSDAWSLFGPLP
jgi:hypothetical protein